MIATDSKPKRRSKLEHSVDGGPQNHTDPPLYLGPRKKSIYESTCPNCNQPIVKGDSIAHAVIYRNGCQRKRWIHDGRTAATGDDAPQPERNGDDVGMDVEARERLKIQAELIDELNHEVYGLTVQNGVLANRLADVEARTPRKLEIKVGDAPKVELDERTHPAFAEILELAAMRKNIFLPGPTGCGKSHIAAQVAKALGLQFGMVSCSAGMSEGQLSGRLLPVGQGGSFEYIISEFVKCYENGGVFLLDEMDAADENVLLVINAALANGKMAVPNRPENPYAYRHADFICIAAANTFGTGADREYVGRNQLDGATLDRFRIGTVPMDYDEALERELVGNDELFERLLRYRHKIRAAKIKRPLSTRFMLDSRDMVKGSGWTLERVDRAFFEGWQETDIRKVKGN